MVFNQNSITKNTWKIQTFGNWETHSYIRLLDAANMVLIEKYRVLTLEKKFQINELSFENLKQRKSMKSTINCLKRLIDKPLPGMTKKAENM